MRTASIAPKMLAVYAQKAKDGKADAYISEGTIALFYNNKQEICVMFFDGDSPVGHTKQLTDREFAEKTKKPA